MAPNALPKSGDAGDAAAGSSKTALLWAYQLRREHVHLVDRLDGMEMQLISSTDRTQANEQNLATLETLVKTLQAENHTLTNEVTLVRTKLNARIEDLNQQIRACVGDNSSFKEVTQNLQCEFRSFAVQLSDLLLNVSEVKDKIAHVELRQLQLTIQPDAEPKQGVDGTSNVETIESRQVESKPKCIVKLVYGKSKRMYFKTEHSSWIMYQWVHNWRIREAGHFEKFNKTVINTPAISQSHADEAAFSTLTESIIPDSFPPVLQPVSQYETVSRRIRQGDQTIDEYFACTSRIRAELPRRKQEGHIVEAFFDGISEHTEEGRVVKAALEDYLDKAGWIWSNLEIFCRPRTWRNKRRAIYNTRARLKAHALVANQKHEAQVLPGIDLANSSNLAVWFPWYLGIYMNLIFSARRHYSKYRIM